MQSDEFEYTLNDDDIARYPVSPRRSAKLLRINPQGEFEHGTFEDLPNYLKDIGCDGLWANETKVIQARLYLRKPTGGRLEIFLLEPVDGVPEVALSALHTSSWRCLVRGGSKWTAETASIVTDGLSLHASPFDPAKGLLREAGGSFQLTFTWTGALSFADVLEKLGRMPLPPYMQRDSDLNDADDYQTVFARLPGSVAAPTAGLHYDDHLLMKLADQDLALNRLTLHVGAGTFRPLSEGDISDHTMHAERCIVTREILEKLASTRKRVATGTTTLRTLESLFWMAVVHVETGEFPETLGQWIPYHADHSQSREVVFTSYEASIRYLLNNAPLDSPWEFKTQIMIRPGYKIQSVIGLVTNFHQPGSTLLCLIAAFSGTPWRDVYAEAIENKYRFLSYGDGCLFEL